MTDNSGTSKVYRRRYYILGIFCLHVIILLTTMNSFSPIANSLEYATEFKDSDLAIAIMLNNCVFLFCMIPITVLINRYGIRKYMVWETVAVALSMVLRCIPTTGRTYVALCVTQNSISSAVSVGLMAVPPLMSVKWFPQNEWRLATGIGIFLPTFGASFAYKIGPAVVPSPEAGYTKEQLLKRIDYFNYGMTVTCVLIAAAIIAYFPDKPPTPPTNVADHEEVDQIGLWQSCKTMLTSVDFWICCFRTLSIGAPVVAVAGLLLPYLRPKGIGQDYAGTIGLVSSLLGVAIALIIGKAADVTRRHLKALIVAPTILSFEGAVWLFLMGQGYLPVTHRSVFVATCLYIAFGGSTIGLIIELACENLYPLGEEYVSAMIMVGSTATTVVITGAFMAPGNDVASVDFIVLVLTFAGLIGAAFLPSNYRRMDAEEASRAKNPNAKSVDVAVVSL